MVMWAQRPNLIILTICVEDCKDPEIKVESDKLIFKGVGGPEKKQHELTINFFKDIDTEVCLKIITYYVQYKTQNSGDCLNCTRILFYKLSIFNVYLKFDFGK